MLVNRGTLKVDLMSFSAHKTYGPKGIGALFVRRKPRVRIEAQMHGGGHERGMRSGTLPTHQIVGMGEAFRIAKEEMDTEIARIAVEKSLITTHRSVFGVFFWFLMPLGPSAAVMYRVSEYLARAWNVTVQDTLETPSSVISFGRRGDHAGG